MAVVLEESLEKAKSLGPVGREGVEYRRIQELCERWSDSGGGYMATRLYTVAGTH